MITRTKEIDWESGVGEAVSFVIVFPLIMFAFLLILYGMQLSLTAQTLQYTTYSATRAAVISENEATALRNAASIISNCMPTGYMNTKSARFDYSYVEGSEWFKGNIIKGTVTVETKLLLPFLNLSDASGNATMDSSICMMLERPAV